MSTDPVSPEVFEPSEFWDEHKNKVLIYVTVLIVALGGYGIYSYVSQRRIGEAEALYASATTDADFQAVISDYPGTRVAGNAMLELGGKLREEKKYDESAAMLRDFIAKYPQHPLLAGAWLSLASTQELQGKQTEALDTLQQTISKFPDAYTAAFAMVSEGRIFVETGKKDDARRVYQDVVAKYQNSGAAHEAMHQLRSLK